MEKVRPKVEKLAWAKQEVEQCMEQLPKVTEKAKMIIKAYFTLNKPFKIKSYSPHDCMEAEGRAMHGAIAERHKEAKETQR